MSDDRITKDDYWIEIKKNWPFGPDLEAGVDLVDGGVRIEITIDDAVGITLTRQQAEALADWIKSLPA